MCTHYIDYFPLKNKYFLRYGLWQEQTKPCLGSVIILQDYGTKLEDIASLVCALRSRQFHVASFEWAPHTAPHKQVAHSALISNHDFRLPLQNLQEIFSKLFLVDLPPPFYVFGIGMGGVLSLAAHHILQSQVRRMVLISPLFAPHGHKVNGLFHHYTRFMSDLGLGGWRTNQPITDELTPLDPIIMARQNLAGNGKNLYPTVGFYQAMLDAASLVLSHEFREKISIPLLCMLSRADRLSQARLAQQFCESLRCAAAITLRHPKRLPFEGNSTHTRQFWRAVDAFIPGTGAPAPDRSLEDGLII